MRNKKFKGKNLQCSINLRDVADENIKIMCVGFLSLRKTGISAKRVAEMYEEFRKVTVPEWQKNCNDDVTAAKLTRALKELKLTQKEITETTYALAKTTNAQNINLLAENVAILCLQINKSFGYGYKRIANVLEYMRTYEGDAVAEANEKLGIKVQLLGDYIPDASKYLPKKQKAPTYTESQRLAAEMEAVRRIQGA